MKVLPFKMSQRMREAAFGFEPGEGPPEDSREGLERCCKVLLERIRMDAEPVMADDLLFSLAVVADWCELHAKTVVIELARRGIVIELVKDKRPPKG